MRLREFRIRQGKTQAEAARELQISQAALAKIELGRRQPRTRLLHRILLWSGEQVQPNDFLELPERALGGAEPLAAAGGGGSAGGAVPAAAPPVAVALAESEAA